MKVVVIEYGFRKLTKMQVALDFIGKRGSTVGVAKSARIQYAREILERELLPHIGIGEYQNETRKVISQAFMLWNAVWHTKRTSKMDQFHCNKFCL